MSTIVTFAVATIAVAEEIRLELDRPSVIKDGSLVQDSDPAVGVQAKSASAAVSVVPRLDASGFYIRVSSDGYLQKLEPTTIHLETQQPGKWHDVNLEVGRYLERELDEKDPRRIRIVSKLQFDLAAGERRYNQEKEEVERESRRRSGGKAVTPKVRSQVLLERIAAVRDENVQAGADPRGKGNPHLPPLPRPALNFEKVETLERVLREQCAWRSVAQVFEATGFAVPDDKAESDFAAAYTMAVEISQALMGNKSSFKHLSDSQFNALAQGSRYELTARFVPERHGSDNDWEWKSAPAIRLADGIVRRAHLEGTLDRQREQSVGWWRIECDAPLKIKPEMAKGDGDCFWTWVETPDANVRYIRFLLHSPGTRYRMTLSLPTATKGEELIVYDGPVNAPAKAPY